MKKNYGTIPLKSGVLISYDFDLVSVENLGKTFKREKSYDKLIYRYDVKSICAFLNQLNYSMRGLAKET